MSLELKIFRWLSAEPFLRNVHITNPPTPLQPKQCYPEWFYVLGFSLVFTKEIGKESSDLLWTTGPVSGRTGTRTEGLTLALR